VLVIVVREVIIHVVAIMVIETLVAAILCSKSCNSSSGWVFIYRFFKEFRVLVTELVVVLLLVVVIVIVCLFLSLSRAMYSLVVRLEGVSAADLMGSIGDVWT